MNKRKDNTYEVLDDENDLGFSNDRRSNLRRDVGVYKAWNEAYAKTQLEMAGDEWFS